MNSEATAEDAIESRRTVTELLAAAEREGTVRRREEDIWDRVKLLVEAKTAAEYDQTVPSLQDIRDLAARSGGMDQFRMRVAELRALNTGKRDLLERLDSAGL